LNVLRIPAKEPTYLLIVFVNLPPFVEPFLLPSLFLKRSDCCKKRDQSMSREREPGRTLG
jgi:hypothetical protein